MTKIVVLAGLVIAALALLIAPHPPRLSDQRSGDPALAGRVANVLGDETSGYRTLSVAFVDGGRITSATLGDDEDGPVYEIGSVTKTLTGMLLADLAADGIVDPQDTLGEVLPGVKLPAATASITLEELASQRSGLPRLAPGVLGLLKTQLVSIAGGNPYAGQDVDRLLAAAEGAEPGDGRGEVGYSNFGMALLGQALAAKAGKPYPDLVSERILTPLGMTSTVLDPAAGDDLSTGETAAGHAAAPWISEGYAPAGVGPRSTAEDLARLVSATAAGTAPGADAATPKFGDEIGYAWFTDHNITWHNGGTGGYRSYVGFDRASRQGVVVLSNTDRGVEWIGRRLLGETPAPAPSSTGFMQVGITVFLLLFAAFGLVAYSIRAKGFPVPDRLRVIGSTLTTAAMLLVVWRTGAWLAVPWWLWAVAVGVAGAGLVALGLQWHALPTMVTGRPGARWAQFAGWVGI